MATDETEERVLRETLDELVRNGTMRPGRAATGEARELGRRTSLYQWPLLRARLIEWGRAIRDAVPASARRRRRYN